MNIDMTRINRLTIELQMVKSRMEELRKEYRVTAQSYFNEFVKQFFDELPEVQTIRWLQYTPYFKDGDTCHFSVHGIYFSNAKPDQLDVSGYTVEDSNPVLWSTEGYKYNDDLIEGRPYLNYMEKPMRAFTEMVNSISDILPDIFGEHVQVTITREGIQIEDYSDHD